MNNKIQFWAIILCIVVVYTLPGCSKSSSPTIVGKWNLSDFSGKQTSNTGSNSGSTITYAFNPNLNTITETDQNTSGGSTTTYTSTTTIITELWEFKSDGTYTINEAYSNSSSAATTATAAGTWDFTGNTQTNNGIIFNGITSEMPSIGDYKNWTIISLDGNQLVLGYSNSASNNSGYSNLVNLTLTMKKTQ